jgi:hypothetical protein
MWPLDRRDLAYFKIGCGWLTATVIALGDIARLPAQEAVTVALRSTLLVSIDDLLAVVREFWNVEASRSGLDRCLRRHGVGNLRDLAAK